MSVPDLLPGAAAPWFRAPVFGGNPDFNFHSVGGRFVLMFFAGSLAWPETRAALALARSRPALFDDAHACLFGITVDAGDAAAGRIAPPLAGVRWFVDGDRAVSRLYGAVLDDPEPRYRPYWMLLDPNLRIVASEPVDRGAAILDRLAALLAADAEPAMAPVLVVPRVLDPDLCRRLIEIYEQDGGHESGFMREENGITVLRSDLAMKRRRDFSIGQGALRQHLIAHLRRSLDPMITRAFQFEPTRIERLLLARYDADAGGGYFRPHRDNTTKGTAHRRFACTINLNAEDYDGGDLRFPEFGTRSYRAPTGGAVVFSCSLLHEALPVIRGRRYALLPFFYDEEGARLRERNTAFVSPEFNQYRAYDGPATIRADG